MPQALRLAANGRVDAFSITELYTAAGEVDHAFEWFDKALADGMLPARLIRYEPELDSLRAESEVRRAIAQVWPRETGGRVVRPLNRKPFLSAGLRFQTRVRRKAKLISVFTALPSISSSGYTRKLIGPLAGAGSTIRSRPLVSSKRFAGL
jgi:hypothetical protein